MALASCRRSHRRRAGPARRAPSISFSSADCRPACEVARLLRGLLGKPDDRVDHRLEVPVAEHDGAEHHLLGELLGFRFDHQHRIGGAGDDEIELALRHLVELRIEHVFVVDEADARGADRSHERHAGERQRRRGRDHGDDVGIVLEIVRQRGDDDLRVAAVALGEQRPDRPVDQARDQRLVLGRAAFALEIAAGNAARGVEFFLVVDGERQEIDAVLRLLGRHDGGQHGGLAICGEDGAVGLAGYLFRSRGRACARPSRGPRDGYRTLCFLSWFSRRDESHEQDGERLRAARAQRATASGDPAMAFEPSMVRGRRSAGPDLLGSIGAAGTIRRMRRIRRTTRGQARAANGQRRMPSRSISVL